MEAASPQPLNLHDELLRDFHDTVSIGTRKERGSRVVAWGGGIRKRDGKGKGLDHL